MLNTPWKLKELGVRKYYGTEILDANDDRVTIVWLPGRTDEERKQSPREEYEPDGDNHYENVRTYYTATAIVNRVNYMGGPYD